MTLCVFRAVQRMRRKKRRKGKKRPLRYAVILKDVLLIKHK